MKSRFTYGMFAGFALACLFFFFFLFFFPNVFRNLTAKNSPSNRPVATATVPTYHDEQYAAYHAPTAPAYYDEEYVAYHPPTAPAYYDEEYVAYHPPTDVAERPVKGVAGVPEVRYGHSNPNPAVYDYDPDDPPYYGRSINPPAWV